MHLKNRIKKIEGKVSANNPEPEFCDCYNKHFDSALRCAYNEAPHAEIEIYPRPDLNKPLCEMCNKPFSKVNLAFSANLQKVYGGQLINCEYHK